MYTVVRFGQKIDALTMVNLFAYILILVLEVFFYSFKNKIDPIGITKDKIMIQFWRQLVEEKKGIFEKSKKNILKRSPIEKLRNHVKALIVLIKLWKKQKNKSSEMYSNPLLLKTLSIFIIWVLIHFSCFFIHPYYYMKLHDSSFLNLDWKYSFLCDSTTSDTICYNYNVILYTKIYYFLNCLYILVSVWQIRKGLPVRLPTKIDYSNVISKFGYYLYYNALMVREVKSLVGYAVARTTLTIEEWLLCDDIRKDMAQAEINSIKNQKKNVGKMNSKLNRVLFGVLLLLALFCLTILPLIIFSNISFTFLGYGFQSSSLGYDIKSASLKMQVIVNNDYKLIDLFESTLLLENRELTIEEVHRLKEIPGVQKLDI